MTKNKYGVDEDYEAMMADIGGKYKSPEAKNILCLLGFHKWTKWQLAGSVTTRERRMCKRTHCYASQLRKIKVKR